MISFNCTGCGQKLTAKDDFAGKKGSCPHCKKQFTVPAPAALAGSGPVVSAPGGKPAAARSAPVAASTKPVAAPPKTGGIALATPAAAGKLAGAASSPPAAVPVAPAAANAAVPPENYDFLAPPQGKDEIGRLGPYRVLKVLGAGGMGVVFQAEDTKLRRLVALKAMKPALAASDSSRQRFLREAQATAAIKHDHIVTIYQVAEDRSVPFLAMEFLQGEALDERLKREGTLPLPEILRIGREAAEGLAAAHEQGLIHRDIKPGNIWLEGKRGRVKILDFGLARAGGEDTHLTKTGAIVGTPAYMAPEQARGDPVDARSDLFSLGCVLYRLSTGQTPFKGVDTMSMLMSLALENPKPPRELGPGLPPAFSDLVMRLLAKEPRQRPSTAQELADSLRAIESNLDPTQLSYQPSATSPAGRGAGAGFLHLLLRGLAAVCALIWRLLRIPGRTGLVIKGVAALLVLGMVLLIAFPRKSSTPGGGTTADSDKMFTNSVGMKMVLIPAGQFLMGSTSFEATGNYQSDGPQHKIVITKPFYMGAHEVTVKQFREFVNATGHKTESEKEGSKGTMRPFQGETMKLDENVNWHTPVVWVQEDNHPVVCVSWSDVEPFCNWLSQKELSSGRSYRLPTEAEWEYACRGGTMSPYNFGETINEKLAKFNVAGSPFQVGQFQPNRFGLYDMHGNVREWCADWYNDSYYNTSPRENPKGPKKEEGTGFGQSGLSKVVRGGSFYDQKDGCRSAFRMGLEPTNRNTLTGFRVVCDPPSPPSAGGKK